MKVVAIVVMSAVLGFAKLVQAQGDPLIPKVLELKDMASDPAAFARAAKAGEAEAQKQWQEGRAVIYSFGLPQPFEYLDRETGLRYQPIAGCIVNDEILGRAQGTQRRRPQLDQVEGRPGELVQTMGKRALRSTPLLLPARLDARRPPPPHSRRTGRPLPRRRHDDPRRDRKNPPARRLDPRKLHLDRERPPASTDRPI